MINEGGNSLGCWQVLNREDSSSLKGSQAKEVTPNSCLVEVSLDSIGTYCQGREITAV